MHARADRLLPVVQMAEPADRSGFVLVVAGDLHAAHRVHGLEVLEELGFIGLGRRRGLVAQVGRVGAREVDGDGRFGGEGAPRLGARGGGRSSDGCAEHGRYLGLLKRFCCGKKQRLQATMAAERCVEF